VNKRTSNNNASAELPSPVEAVVTAANDGSLPASPLDVRDAAKAVALTETLQKLRALPVADVLSTWLSLTAPLPADQAELVVKLQ
jgi:hypothetical protein